MLIQHQPRILVDDLLHCILHKLIEALELLSHQPLLLEERRDDRPVIFLLQLVLVLRQPSGIVPIPILFLQLRLGLGDEGVRGVVSESIVRVDVDRGRRVVSRRSRCLRICCEVVATLDFVMGV